MLEVRAQDILLRQGQKKKKKIFCVKAHLFNSLKTTSFIVVDYEYGHYFKNNPALERFLANVRTSPYKPNLLIT